MDIPYHVLREGKKKLADTIDYAKSAYNYEQAIEILANTKYCRHWAAGMCSFAGLKPGTKEFERCVERLSRRLAERLI